MCVAHLHWMRLPWTSNEQIKVQQQQLSWHDYSTVAAAVAWPNSLPVRPTTSSPTRPSPKLSGKRHDDEGLTWLFIYTYVGFVIVIIIRVITCSLSSCDTWDPEGIVIERIRVLDCGSSHEFSFVDLWNRLAQLFDPTRGPCDANAHFHENNSRANENKPNENHHRHWQWLNSVHNLEKTIIIVVALFGLGTALHSRRKQAPRVGSDGWILWM